MHRGNEVVAQGGIFGEADRFLIGRHRFLAGTGFGQQARAGHPKGLIRRCRFAVRMREQVEARLRVHDLCADHRAKACRAG